MKKRARVVRGTWYAVRANDDNDLWWPDKFTGSLGKGFTSARLFSRRDLAVSYGSIIMRGCEIVPVRAYPLRSKRRNPKRTR